MTERPPVEVAKANVNLGEMWIDEVNMWEIHKNASREIDHRLAPAMNETYSELNDSKDIVHGQRLRYVFGYTDAHPDDVERAAKEATSAAQSAEQAINEVTER